MPSSQLVQSVTRAMRILEHLANAENGMTLQQICQELDLKPTTAHNLLRTLVARGFVERLAEPTRYSLGRNYLELADHHRTLTTQRHAASAVSQVYARFNQVRVIYCEDIGGDVVLKLRMTPERPGLLERPYHSVMLAYSSASVLVFHAFWREEQRLQYEAKYPFETYGVHIWGDYDRLLALLNEIRQQGHAELPSELKVNNRPLYRVAVPVFSAQNSLIGVLGAAFGQDDVEDISATKAGLIEQLKTTATLFTET